MASAAWELESSQGGWTRKRVSHGWIILWSLVAGVCGSTPEITLRIALTRRRENLVGVAAPLRSCRMPRESLSTNDLQPRMVGTELTSRRAQARDTGTDHPSPHRRGAAGLGGTVYEFATAEKSVDTGIRRGRHIRPSSHTLTLANKWCARDEMANSPSLPMCQACSETAPCTRPATVHLPPRYGPYGAAVYETVVRKAVRAYS